MRVWLERLMDTMLRRDRRRGSTAQARRVAALLARRDEYPDAPRFYAAILASLPAAEPLDDDTIAQLARSVRGAHADAVANDGAEELWHQLSLRFPTSAYARACYADTLAVAGNWEAALPQFADAFDAQPALLFEFGGDVHDRAERCGGELWLRYQLACLRAALDAGDQADEHDDFVRELYSELLEEYQADPEAMRRILRIGAQLRDLEADDRLPRAIVRRGSSRK